MGRCRLLLVTLCLVLLDTLFAGASDIASTKHNLTASSGNTIRALSEDRICIFCHTPHNANPAVGLWNHVATSDAYTIYSSSTIDGATSQPLGSSKLCLTCHDGSIALGNVLSLSSIIEMVGTAVGGEMPAGSTNLGMDLRNDHPVSIAASSADPELIIPTEDPDIKYIVDGADLRVECTSCHNPHDDTYGKFLRKLNVVAGVGSQVCIVCHDKLGWSNSAHHNSLKQYNGTPVQQLACDACHNVHNSQVNVRLLDQGEENLCLTCHGGAGRITDKDALAPFQLTYAHPVTTISGQHDAAEVGPINAGATNSGDAAANAHAECVDCHGPHSVQGGRHTQGSSKIGSVLLGAWGMKPIYDPGLGAYADPIGWEKVVFSDTTSIDSLEAYLCFKCHPEKAKEFNPYNGSYHAVMAPVAPPKTSGYGQYINGWTATSAMTCSDCHGTSNTSSTVIQGPHGSSYDCILPKRFKRNDDLNEGEDGTATGVYKNYNTDDDLCFQCHDRNYYGKKDANERNSGYYTGFAKGTDKNLHNDEHDGIACTTCHTVHGSRDPRLLTDFKDGSRGFPENRNSLLKVNTWRDPLQWTDKDYCNHDCK